MAPDSGDPDPTIMDSAMDTGSDVGEPGDRPAEPLSDDERALLERLVEDENDQSTVVVTDAPEDSPPPPVRRPTTRSSIRTRAGPRDGGRQGVMVRG